MFGDILTSMIYSMRQRQNEKTVNNLNQQNRGITEYLPSDVGGFFPLDDGANNITVSGGYKELRAKITASATASAVAAGLPAVILHASDRNLEQEMKNIFGSSGMLYEVNPANPIYEPFLHLNSDEIGQLIKKAATPDYEFSSSILYYINSVYDYLEYAGKSSTLYMFSQARRTQLTQRITTLMQNVHNTQTPNIMQNTNSIITNINSNFMSGQADAIIFDDYISDLYRQAAPIMSISGRNSTNCNIKAATQKKRVIMIDVGSGNNNLLIKFLFQQLKDELSGGYKKISLTISGLSDGNKCIEDYILNASNSDYIVYSSEDLFSANERIYSKILGRSSKIAYLKHSQGGSSKRCAEAIGQYDHIKKSVSNSAGYSTHAGFGSNGGISYLPERDLVVKPEQIESMLYNEAYIYTSSTNELAHTTLG